MHESRQVRTHISILVTMACVIAIEGNIGSGKSTFINALKHRQSAVQESALENFVFVSEPVDVWQTVCDSEGETILEKFYRDPSKYAFSFQMMAYITRLVMLRKTLVDNPGKVVICERSILTDKHVFANMLHAEGHIEDVNFTIYTKWFDEFQDDINIKAMQTVYIQTRPDKCFERVAKRCRKGESISLEYLSKCHEYHEKWLMSEDSAHRPSVVLDGNVDRELESDDVYNHWIQAVLKLAL